MVRSSRRVAVAALTLTALLGAAAPVAANTRDAFIVTFDPEPVDQGFCDFETLWTEDGTFQVADLYDDAGVLYRSIVTAYGQLTLTIWNPANGKTAITHNESQVIIVDWLPDGSRESISRMGLVVAMTLPGVGVVLLDAGHLVHDYTTGSTSIAGPHQLLFGDFEALCAALA